MAGFVPISINLDASIAASPKLHTAPQARRDMQMGEPHKLASISWQPQPSPFKDDMAVTTRACCRAALLIGDCSRLWPCWGIL